MNNEKAGDNVDNDCGATSARKLEVGQVWRTVGGDLVQIIHGPVQLSCGGGLGFFAFVVQSRCEVNGVYNVFELTPDGRTWSVSWYFDLAERIS